MCHYSLVMFNNFILHANFRFCENIIDEDFLAKSLILSPNSSFCAFYTRVKSQVQILYRPPFNFIILNL